MTRRASLTGISTDAPGGGVVTKYSSDAEIVRLPAGSIVSIPRHEAPLEPLDLATARLNKAVVLALAVNFLSWGLILLAGRALARVFL
jgi:hypothetical protein